MEAQSIWSDDGIALHLPDADAPPPLDEIMISPDEIEELVVQEVGQSALFGARFRENAARALLIPRRRPDQRTPLWQQRLKAQSLLQVARRYGSFPIILETYRECLQDVFDLPALKRLLQGLRTREIDLVDVETASASPYSASLLFDYIATYMYEDDTPPAERRAQALSLDRDLLRELLGQEELRDLLDADALEEVETQLRGNPRNADQLHDQLRLRGDLREGEYDEGFAQTLLRERRALLVRFAGEQRLIAAEDAGRYRDALGVMPPGGLPEVFLEGGADSLEQLVLRYAQRTRAVHDGAGERALRTRRRALAAAARAAGEAPARRAPSRRNRARVVRPGRAAAPAACVARCAAARRSSPPSRRRSAGSCRTGTGSTAARRCVRRSCRCRDSSLPVSLWESEVLPRRVPGFNPGQLDQLCASGEVVWVGAGLDRVAVFFREDAPALGRPAATPRPEGEEHDRIRDALGRSAEFWYDLVAATELEPEVALPALWDLVWAGEVTNDAWTPLRAGRRYQRGANAARPPTPFLAPAIRRNHRDAGSLVADRQALPRTARRAVRSRSCCSSGRESSRATACAAREFRAATAPSTASCARSKRSASAAAATSSRGSAARSSHCPARSSDCESCVRARTRNRRRSCCRRPTRRSRTAPRCRGRSVPARARHASQAPKSSCSAASPHCSSSAADARSCRCAIPKRRGSASRSPRSSSTSRRAAARRALAVERFDSEPVGETEIMPLLLEAGFLAGPRRAVLRP